ncbi:ABC transporter permease [Sphaerochaeta halotolerans]|jgi:peptide/nickel transport system permease protein|uniref:ABC transporter permease n=1 Tax=Sphaerochaeta halotolerans TaxID=2293840 RepID=A0A372MEY8_9SPIR|nr:ABC transporter permease [Sphaerochaeta halotolerans]MBG0766780.1 ABC transporter permease [Spirochaetaceae bacterium]MDK2859733.1 peptide/nickel transport system permease protein [Sphaerochaeta sp.]MDN5333121.1 peptide/nickel transport system permease protein [Sphaerochaeta sp.]MXI85880.1 ABC transporter permease subunit [Sphaerochaeta halotolerans]RFU94341.1 ABC transporter permease [Sphaerochaeta halotolerans]
MKRLMEMFLRRLGSLLATLVVMSFVIFLLVEIMPGDVAQMILGQSATEEAVAALREARGLNDPLLERYGRWISGVVVGDLGDSIYMQGVSINSILWRKVGHSIILAMTAFIIFVPLSIFFGVLAGVKEKKPTDSIISFFGLATMALPEFVSGVILITVFAVQLKWFPIVSVIPIGESIWQNLNIVVLPALSITLVMFGYISRMQRSSMISVMNSDYIRAATLKGMPRRYVIFRHALKNAMLPTITIIGMNMGWLFGGLVVVETLFGFPGMGSLLMTAIKTRDVPLIEACVLLITVIYSVSTMITDIMYSYLNPRIRYQGGQK